MKTEDWSDASINQGMIEIAGKPSEARMRQGRIPYRYQREHGPAKPGFQTSGFQNCERINFCCFKASSSC